MLSTKFQAESLLIKDPERIKKYMASYSKFYIPPSEADTFDPLAMVNNTYVKSKNLIGIHHPIEVAINENDPNEFNTKSPYRIHLRIIDGRHRWTQSIKSGFQWDVKFYEVSNYQQFMLLRGHFDLKKDTNPMERIKFFEDLCHHYEFELKIPRPSICAAICKDFSPSPFNEGMIRRYIGLEYKDVMKTEAMKAGLVSRQKETIREIQEKKPEIIRSDFALFRRNIEQLSKENEYLRSKIGTQYYNDTWYVVESRSSKTDKIWKYSSSFKNLNDAISYMKELNLPTKLVEVKEDKETLEQDETHKISKVSITTNVKQTKEESDKDRMIPTSKKFIIVTKKITGKDGIECYQCHKDLLVGMNVYSKSTRTKNQYYCSQCAVKLSLI